MDEAHDDTSDAICSMNLSYTFVQETLVDTRNKPLKSKYDPVVDPCHLRTNRVITLVEKMQAPEASRGFLPISVLHSHLGTITNAEWKI